MIQSSVISSNTPIYPYITDSISSIPPTNEITKLAMTSLGVSSLTEPCCSLPQQISDSVVQEFDPASVSNLNASVEEQKSDLCEEQENCLFLKDESEQNQSFFDERDFEEDLIRKRKLEALTDLVPESQASTSKLQQEVTYPCEKNSQLIDNEELITNNNESIIDQELIQDETEEEVPFKEVNNPEESEVPPLKKVKIETQESTGRKIAKVALQISLRSVIEAGLGPTLGLKAVAAFRAVSTVYDYWKGNTYFLNSGIKRLTEAAALSVPTPYAPLLYGAVKASELAVDYQQKNWMGAIDTVVNAAPIDPLTKGIAASNQSVSYLSKVWVSKV